MTFPAEPRTPGQLNGQIIETSLGNKQERAERGLNMSNTLKIMYTNIRGLKGKRSSLIEQLSAEQPHLFLLTETLLTTNSDIQIEGYTFFGRARTGRLGGGVAILAREDIRNYIIPHISDRDIEMIWVSYKKKKCPPLFIGCYYGKQESRCSKDEITVEMTHLAEEIQENSAEGEILIFMDGNGKIGILGEEKTRNGKLIEEVIESHGMNFLNKNQKCIGKVTRENTSNAQERSAIDFVVSTQNVEKRLVSMLIDEQGIYKVKGKKESDHNTIITEFQIPSKEKLTTTKRSVWRLNAPAANWQRFNADLGNLSNGIHHLLASNKSIDAIYDSWLQRVEGQARKNLGRTTIRTRKTKRFSLEVENLRLQKRELKDKLKKRIEEKEKTLKEIKTVQEQLRQKILGERAEKTRRKLLTITQDASRNSFWRERKKLRREPVKENLTVKDTEGNRQYSPEKVMETMASYYEDLYKIKPVRPHSIHELIKTKTADYLNDKSADNEWYNHVPTERQITEVLENKKMLFTPRA